MELKVRLLEGKVQEETLKIQQKHDEMVQKVYTFILEMTIACTFIMSYPDTCLCAPVIKN